ncbi:MAG: hypothetical protein ACTSQK_08815, partial [Candidatus Heimdallarchaeota archaeon]
NEIMNNGSQLKREAKITSMLTIFLVVLFTLSTANTILTFSATTPSSKDLSMTVINVDEIVVGDYHRPISMGTHYRNSIIQINITILPISNGSVEVFAFESYITEFSPTLTNFTLAPGESFTENYTYIKGTLNELVYYCRCMLPDTNATVRWWYEVLHSVGPSVFIKIEFPFILGGLVLFTLCMKNISKKKSYKKND